MLRSLTALALIATFQAAFADGNHVHHAFKQDGAVLSDADGSKVASFDILAAHVHRSGNTVTFHMTTNGQAGVDTPEATGSVGYAGDHSL